MKYRINKMKKQTLSWFLIKTSFICYLFIVAMGAFTFNTVAYLSEYTEMKGSLKVGVWEEKDAVLDENEKDTSESEKDTSESEKDTSENETDTLESEEETSENETEGEDIEENRSE